MRKFIKIDKPCGESWDNMQEVSGGRFCAVCEKKVWDLDNLDDSDLLNLKDFCGKTSSKGLDFTKLFFAFTLTSAVFAEAQSVKNSSIENFQQRNVTISGKLFSKQKMKLESGTFSLVTLEKVYSANADKEGNFTLSFPEKVLNNQNVIRIDYTATNNFNHQVKDYKTAILKNSELLGRQNFNIGQEFSTIGAVVLTLPSPPDFYYFNGKKIAKRKFEKIRKENPDYAYLAFYDDTAVRVLTAKTYIGNLYLLYSK